MGLINAVTFFLADYARLVAAAVLSMALASVIFRILWEVR